ncbi:thiamine diphosphokinase [Cohnella luojiensis]|uniref:Thiamine diphosphokinase n=1 Tax=Cohnella luojiensis TaxID=652876 RepID=A0A4Y8LV98_9BACL|nr:thiamine diphosphokinase [Cohnella luojiensis]TFE24885.1 thiamine diphosphokinase [Cohnella luojiensis]
MSIHSNTRALIFTGGNLGQWALDQLSSQDYVIGADRGAEFLIHNGKVPHLALGDFDSVTSDQMKRIAAEAVEFLTCDAIDKDWTDTELALREAIGRGYKEIMIMGALGTRFDHVLGNVHLLRQAREQGSTLTLIDENNEIRLCTEILRLKANSRFPYTSLLPLTLEVKGVTLQGFRYPLHDATLKLGWSLGISNVLDAPEGTISIADGMLLVIRSRD